MAVLVGRKERMERSIFSGKYLRLWVVVVFWWINGLKRSISLLGNVYNLGVLGLTLAKSKRWWDLTPWMIGNKQQFTSSLVMFLRTLQYFEYNFLPYANHPNSKSLFCNTLRRQTTIPFGDCFGLQIPWLRSLF